MIYIDGKDSDFSIFEVKESDDEVYVLYSELGRWTDKFKGKRSIAVTNTDGDLNHYVYKEDGTIVRFDVSETIQLYFALDYMYKHSKLDCATGNNALNTLKFEKVDD